MSKRSLHSVTIILPIVKPVLVFVGIVAHTQAGLLLGCLEVMIEDVVAEATGTVRLPKPVLCCMPESPKQARLEIIDLIHTYLGNSCSSTKIDHDASSAS